MDSQKAYITEIKEDHIYKKAREIVATGVDNSFYILDVQSVRDRVNKWKQYLPNAQMHYSVKTNCEPAIIREMVALGQHFDCTSINEIKLVLSSGAKAENIIFANPCKAPKHILFAKTAGVKKLVIDSSEEVLKCKELYPEAELVLRIAVTETDAPNPMGKKFGAPAELWGSILDTCKNEAIKLLGVSFHVGSGGCHFSAYQESLENAKKIFAMTEEKGMPEMELLDVGGGFSFYNKDEECNFPFVATQLRKALDTYFPGPNSKIKVMGEPGRNISQEAQTLVCQIFLVKQQGSTRHYYINNGVYQGFGCRVFDDETMYGQPLLPAAELPERFKNETNSFMWGQTCDGCDWIHKDAILPYMNQYEWVMYRNMGAYNESVECAFNGFEAPDTFYIDSGSKE